MKRLSWFLFGASFMVLAAAVFGIVFLKTARGFSAREKPSRIEEWIARQAREMAIPKDARERKNPIANSENVLTEARAHWADHCAGCHANNGSGQIEIGKKLYPPSPDMRKDQTQRLSDGELFYIIENGIRLSGMPAWGSAEHGEEDSWRLVHFIRHLPQLSFEEEREMRSLNPKNPAELEEEKAEEKFLKGDNTDETHETPKHRH